MQIHILAVGKMKPSPEMALCKEYQKRLNWQVTIHEITGKLPNRNAEAEALAAKIPANAIAIQLDETGKSFTSKAFAKKIGDWQQNGQSQFAFLIGGADGHGDAVRERADMALSMSNFTMPHMLCRAVLMEQLYRASTILQGHPYHRV